MNGLLSRLCDSLPRSVCFLLAFGPLATCNALPAAEPPPPPLFSRHVVPVLSRLGCNAGGACHGTVLGQNGFRLSLFGGQPALDHARLTREVIGRRVSPLQPEASLILLKATGEIAHGGGKRTNVGSSDYQVLHDWIAAGGRLDDVAQSRLARLTVTPAELTLQPGESGRFAVTAIYTDGATADVTALCRYESHDTDVATIDQAGAVRANAVGDTAAIIRYGSEPVLASILVVTPASKPFPEIKPHNFIDEHILAKLKALNLPPAALCDDTTFLRRLHLDVTGYLPTPDEVRAFLANARPDKRDRKIDEVLARPGYAEVWAAQFSDLVKPVERGNEGNNNIMQGQVLRIRFYEWLRARLAENVPYDQLVERMLLSSSLEGRPVEDWLAERSALQAEIAKKQDKARSTTEPLLAAYNARRTLDLYWERDGAVGVGGAMQFAHAFLGLRLQCAQCHRHPNDVWQQDDLLSFANFFNGINTAGGARKNSPEVAAYAESKKAEIQEWTEELKKLNQSKDKADKMKATELQAKITAVQAPLREEIAAVVGPAAPFASIRNTLGTQESRVLRLLGAKSNTELAAVDDRRAVLMAWLRQQDNPFFARAIVNRVWAYYLGRGLIDPPDNLSPLNPPSHPRLLDELCKGFIKNGYDLRWLHRMILQSRTYQQSQQPDEASRDDRRNFARFAVRRLPGEVILDTLNQATGAQDKYPPHWLFRDGERAVFVAGVMVDVFTYQQSSDPFRYLIFGRQVRRPTVQCDCEQGKDVTLPQVFFLANHPEVRQKIATPAGSVARLADDKTIDDRRRIEELFLRSLARLPSADELKAGLDHLKISESLRKGLEEVLWSLVNTREFQLNY